MQNLLQLNNKDKIKEFHNDETLLFYLSPSGQKCPIGDCPQLSYPIIIFTITSNIAPGTPNIPMNIDVNKFNPIWKSNIAPTQLIPYIINPPNIEFNTSFNMLFIGNINTLPNINKKQIHAKYVITVLSKFNHLVLLLYLYD